MNIHEILLDRAKKEGVKWAEKGRKLSDIEEERCKKIGCDNIHDLIESVNGNVQCPYLEAFDEAYIATKTAEVIDKTREAPEAPKKEERDKWVISSGARGKYLELYLRDFEKPIVIAIPQNDFDFILAGIQTLLNGKKTDELDKAITSAFGNTFQFTKASKPSPKAPEVLKCVECERYTETDSDYYRCRKDNGKYNGVYKSFNEPEDLKKAGCPKVAKPEVPEAVKEESDLKKRVSALETEFNGHEDRINRLGQTPFTRYSKTFTIYEHEDRISALEKDSWNKAMHKDTQTQIDAMTKEIKDLQAENGALKKAVRKLRKAVKK